jgi:hypothetical protein
MVAAIAKESTGTKSVLYGEEAWYHLRIQPALHDRGAGRCTIPMPLTETTAPDNVIFKDATSAATALQLDNLAPGKLHGVWRREWIMDGHQARAGIDADTRYSWS